MLPHCTDAAVLKSETHPLSISDKEHGRTTLHYCFIFRKAVEDIVRVIEAYPAALSIKDNEGKSPLDFIASESPELLWSILTLVNDNKDVGNVAITEILKVVL